MPRIKELAHTVIYVSDLAASRDWYCKHLGMTVVVDSPERKSIFLSFGKAITTSRCSRIPSQRAKRQFIISHSDLMVRQKISATSDGTC